MTKWLATSIVFLIIGETQDSWELVEDIRQNWSIHSFEFVVPSVTRRFAPGNCGLRDQVDCWVLSAAATLAVWTGFVVVDDMSSLIGSVERQALNMCDQAHVRGVHSSRYAVGRSMSNITQGGLVASRTTLAVPEPRSSLITFEIPPASCTHRMNSSVPPPTPK